MITLVALQANVLSCVVPHGFLKQKSKLQQNTLKAFKAKNSRSVQARIWQHLKLQVIIATVKY